MKLCRTLLGGFTTLYVLALASLIAGTFGLFGTEPDPLSGIFLIPLGMPWVNWLTGFPAALLPWVGAVAPLINLAILRFICRLVGRLFGRR